MSNEQCGERVMGNETRVRAITSPDSKRGRMRARIRVEVQWQGASYLSSSRSGV